MWCWNNSPRSDRRRGGLRQLKDVPHFKKKWNSGLFLYRQVLVPRLVGWHQFGSGELGEMSTSCWI